MIKRNKIIDWFNILSKFSLRKFTNAALSFLSFHLSRWRGQPTIWSLPVSVSVEPTTACNLSCPECPSGLKQFSRATGNLKMDFFESLIQQLKPTTVYLTFYFQGEPYINLHFLEMVQLASKNKFYTATSTNAHFLTNEMAKKTVKSGLDRLIISLDGTTQEIYEQYRINGKLDKVLEGANNVISWKQKLKSKTPYIIFQFLVVKPNEHQIKDAEILTEKMGADEIRFKTAQLYDYKKGNALMPENENYSRYKKQTDGTYKIKNKLLNQCWRMWQGCVITWDGKIVPCCFDKDAKYKLGDLQTDKLNEIWNSKSYNNFRKSILKSRNEIDICTNCTEGTKVWG